MNDYQFSMLVGIMEIMLGVFFWPLIIGVVLITILFIVLLLRERQIYSRRLLHAQILGIFGGWFALWIMAVLSESGFSDAGGPIDWLVIVIVYVLGFFGTAILWYTLSGWLGLGKGTSAKSINAHIAN